MKRVTDLQKHKHDGHKITWVTCYDFWSASVLKNTDIDALLVGDSLAMVMHGFDSTIHATVDMMATHTAAVARAQTEKLIIADLPFLAHRCGKKSLVQTADKLMKAGAHALKIETAPGQEKTVQWLSESGVPMIGHVGLTPQFVHQFGGYKVQGRDPATFEKILKQAIELEKAGCHAMVLECVPSDLAKQVTSNLKIPTIGIGAGADVDGQVLVLQDMLGFNSHFKPRFVREFAHGMDWMLGAVKDFTQSVKTVDFPKQGESFS